MKIIKKIINVFTTLIIIVGGVFLGLYLIGITPYVVLSGSMEPTIKTGSLCFINKHSSFEDIKEKDIIAYRLNNGILVTHRAIKITKSCIVTKGDNNNVDDGCNITKDNFVGKNVLWIPKLGYIIKAFQTTKGKIIFISFLVILLVFGLLFGENNNKKIKKEE